MNRNKTETLFFATSSHHHHLTIENRKGTTTHSAARDKKEVEFSNWATNQTVMVGLDWIIHHHSSDQHDTQTFKSTTKLVDNNQRFDSHHRSVEEVINNDDDDDDDNNNKNNDGDDDNSNNNNNNNNRRTMGNLLSTESCTSGIEGVKADILTVVTTDEVQEFMARETVLDEPFVPSREEHSSEPFKKNMEEGSHAVSSMHTTGAPSISSTQHHPKKLLKRVRRKSAKGFHKLSHFLHAAGQVVGHTLKHVEEFFFPHTPSLYGSAHPHAAHGTSPHIAMSGGVLLNGCHTEEEHRIKTRETVELVRPLHGADGLKAVGLEYRVVPFNFQNDSAMPELICENEMTAAATAPADVMDEEAIEMRRYAKDSYSEASHSLSGGCPETMTRLFHIESNTMITNCNRKEFIADGDMYDAIARLCQEAAQEIMIAEGNLEWVLVSDAGNNPEPIRALVSKNVSMDEAALDTKPTLLIATGKGKVRAGVFSRQHLIMSGMEVSTALPVVRGAVKREMNIVMLDPNVHGDRLGMATFEKSMARLFRRWEEGAATKEETQSSHMPPLASRDLYVLSHSQSGAQLARYLLEKSELYLPHIRAVAFTDSTHNIQWARENKDLHQMLQSDTCVYFKCSKEHSEDRMKPLDSLGSEVETDQYWQHRFGNIRTRCAGTSEHSLTNWFARYHIWDHFDSFLRARPSRHSRNELPL